MGTSTPFPRRLWTYTVAVFVAASGAAILLIARDGLPEAAPLVMFGALLVFARNRDVSLPADLKGAPTTMISIATVVVFVAHGAPGGAVLVGMLHGIYIPSFTRRSWGWVPFNAGLHGLAALAAVLAYRPFESTVSTSLLHAVLPLLAVSAAYLIAERVLLVGSYLVELGQVPGEVWTSLPRSALEDLPFAVLGFVVGRMYLSLGSAVVLLMIAPIVIAREMFASYMRVKESQEDTVSMLIHALEQKDHYTAGHAERVATYAHYIGEELNFMPARLERLRFAALMHDIGKLVVPNHLLNKPGRLTAEEFARVRVHEKVSVQMLSHIDFLRPIAGSGHSDNTRFNPDDPDHPIEPYIVMIADAYDAMTSTRAYRKALSQQVAFQELRDNAGAQFHPACVEALIGAIERRGEKHGAGYEQQPEFADAPAIGVGSAGLGDLMPSEAS